ncbi:MAG: hypothetical protein ACOCZK_01950 [Planctomycetota bacterium]
MSDPAFSPELARERLQSQFDPRSVRVRLNHNRRTLVSLRGRREGGWMLSVHAGLATTAALDGELRAFVRQRGRGDYPRLRQAMSTLFRQLHSLEALSDKATHDRLADLPVVGSAPNLVELAAEIHRAHFADLPAVPVGWGRNPGRRALRSIRFGSYKRSRGAPEIRISPRLSLPWVALVFFQHVIHHEYCHHRQFIEGGHGRPGGHCQRFRRLERAFPGYELAMTWERCHAPRLLDPYGQGRL